MKSNWQFPLLMFHEKPFPDFQLIPPRSEKDTVDTYMYVTSF